MADKTQSKSTEGGRRLAFDKRTAKFINPADRIAMEKKAAKKAAY
jgi:hypothetical protein